MELSAIRHIADKRCCLSVGNNGFYLEYRLKKAMYRKLYFIHWISI